MCGRPSSTAGIHKRRWTPAASSCQRSKNEEAFDQARPELSTLLPEIATKFAQRADSSKSISEAEDLLGKVDEAMDLVNNSTYIPTSERKNQQARIDDILELKEKVEREIGRNRSLETAVNEIRAAIASDDTAKAYEVRKQLLKLYPGLETDSGLVAVVEEITERARGLVANEPAGLEVATVDFAADGTLRVLLAGNGGRALPGADNFICLVKVNGAVYGVDAASGRVLWRRFVGYDTTIQPQPLSADAGRRRAGGRWRAQRAAAAQSRRRIGGLAAAAGRAV